MKLNGAMFVLAFLHVHSVEMGDLIELFREICPFTSFCTIGPRLNFTASGDYAPCCTQCFCDKACWKFQDCCPDMPHTHTNLDLQMSCIPSVVNSPAVVDSFSNLGTYPSYRMFNTCPPSFTGSVEIVRKCNENYTQEVPDLDDVVIVSNIHYHDEIYKNKHCAACHGVEDIVRWDLYTSGCPGVLGGDVTFADIRWYIWHNCTLFSKPPAHLTFNRGFMDCGESMTSDCKDKKGFEALPNIRAMCETGHYAPVSVSEFLAIHQFKNPYCALCLLDPPEVADVCSADVLSDSRSIGTNSITALLDINPSPQSDVKAEPRCALNETFDYVMNRCRLLNCPWNSHIHFGECVTFSHWVTDIQVRIKMLFRPVDDFVFGYELTEYDEDESVEFVADILRTLKLGPCRPSILYAIAYLESNTETLKFVMVNSLITLSDTCTFKYILRNQKYNAPLTFYKDITMNNMSRPMYGHIYFAEGYNSNYVLDPSVFTQKHLTYYTRANVQVYVLEEFFICPYFSMNVTEYNSILLNCNISNSSTTLSTLKRTDRIHRDFYVLSDSTIAVCKETYFRLCGAKSTAATYGLSVPLCFLFLCLAYYHN